MNSQRGDLTHSYCTHKTGSNYEVMDELINSIVVIPSQCDHHMYTSNAYDFICPLYFSKAGNKFIVEFINWHNNGRSDFPLINEWHSTYMAGYTFAWVPLHLHKLSCLIIPSVVGGARLWPLTHCASLQFMEDSVPLPNFKT